MIITKKIKTINKKIEQNKAQYDLHKQTAKMLVLSFGNISQKKFLTGKDILPQKDFV